MTPPMFIGDDTPSRFVRHLYRHAHLLLLFHAAMPDLPMPTYY